MPCERGMLEVGWLPEGLSLRPFAPKSTAAEASPHSKLSPDGRAEGPQNTQVPLAQGGWSPSQSLPLLKGCFVQKRQCHPHAQPRERAARSTSPGTRRSLHVAQLGGGSGSPRTHRSPFPGERQPCKPKPGQIQHVLPKGHPRLSSPAGKRWERCSGGAAVAVTCPSPATTTHFFPSFAVGSPWRVLVPCPLWGPSSSYPTGK